MLQWTLNLLALVIVGAAAVYVLRHGARLMGWGPGGVWPRGSRKAENGLASPPGRSDMGACGAGACGQCRQREAHGRSRGKA